MSKSRCWAKRLSLTALVLFIIYLFTGCFVVSPVVRHLIVSEGSAFLKRPLQLRNFYFNPLSFEIQLDELELGDDQGEVLLKIKRIKGNLQVSSLTFGGAYIKSVSVDGLDLSGKLMPGGKTNIDELLALFQPKDSAPVEKSTSGDPVPVFVERIDLTNFHFSFCDKNLTPYFVENLGPLNISITNIDTRPKGETGSLKLDFDCQAGATFSVNSQFQISPLHSEGELVLQGLQVQRGQPYWLPIIDCQAQAEVSFKIPYEFLMEAAKPEVKLKQAQVFIKSISNRAPAHPEFVAEVNSVELGFDVSLLKQSINVYTLEVSGNEIQSAIYKDGSLALPLPASGGAQSSSTEPQAEPTAPSTAMPWTVTLPLANIHFAHLKFIDHISEVEQTHELVGTQFSISEFTFDSKSAPVSLKLQSTVQGGGDIASLWKLDLLSQKGQGEFSLKDFNFTPYNPYLKKYADIQLQEGSVSLKANIHLAEAIGAEAEIQLAPTTVLLVSSGEKFFGVSANVEGIHYDPQTGVVVDLVKIIAPEALLTMDSNGQIVLPNPQLPQGNTESPISEVANDESSDASKPEAASLPFLVKKFEIVEGQTFFMDQTVSPAFSSNVEAFSLQVTNISSDPAQKAEITGSGTLD
jgi:hypothetical protein